MQITLKELRDGARDRAYIARDSDTVPDAEANLYVNQAHHELYDLITVADEAKLFAVNATNPPKIGENFTYQLPDDFYRMVSVHVYYGGVYVNALPGHPQSYAELADWASRYGNQGTYRYLTRWKYNTGERFVYVFPAPPADTLALTYWPEPKTLSVDSDQIDNPASWTEYIMVSAAIRMMDKVERDPTALLMQKRQLDKRITQAVYSSDFNYPRVTQNEGRQAYLGEPWLW